MTPSTAAPHGLNYTANGLNYTAGCLNFPLQEAAQLYDRGRPDNNDAYRSTYCARYEMNFRPGSGWRISSGAVLY
jgi:hypothetical protein